MNTNKITLVVLICIILAILIYFLCKLNVSESFQGSDFKKLTILDGNGEDIGEFKNINQFQEIDDPDPSRRGKKIEVATLDKNSSFSFIRNKDTDKNFTLGCYFKKKRQASNYKNFITATNNDDETVLFISLNIDHIQIEYKNGKLSIPIDTLNNLDNEDFSYIFITADLNNAEFEPKFTIICNNKKYESNMQQTDVTEQLTIKQFFFGNPNSDENGFEGLIGGIVIEDEIKGNSFMCDHFNCSINCFIPDGTKDYDGNVNMCIKDCMLSCNDIVKCQKICLDCEVENYVWDSQEKKTRCPWLKEIKVEQTVPDAPEIRGFPGDGKILIEWRKPFDGRSDISNYVVLYYETFSKKNGANVSISSKTDIDICEYEIKNLKNRTYYDVVVRAINNKGLGKPSNIITVAPNGNVISNNNRNIFTELEDELQKEVDKTKLDFMCNLNNFDSVGHSLDFYDDDMNDVKSYIEKLKGN